MDERRPAAQLLGLTGRNGSGGRAFEPAAGGEDLMMMLSSGLPKAGFGFSPAKPAAAAAAAPEAAAAARANRSGELGSAERPGPEALKALPKFRQGNAEPLRPSSGNKSAAPVVLAAPAAEPLFSAVDKQPSWKLSTNAPSLKSAAEAQAAKAAATTALNATGGNAVRLLRCSGQQLNLHGTLTNRAAFLRKELASQMGPEAMSAALEAVLEVHAAAGGGDGRVDGGKLSAALEGRVQTSQLELVPLLDELCLLQARDF